MTTTAITGNTYPVRDALRALGGRWNPDRKAWMVPADRADEAQALVGAQPARKFTAAAASGGKVKKRCFGCGRPMWAPAWQSECDRCVT